MRPKPVSSTRSVRAWPPRWSITRRMVASRQLPFVTRWHQVSSGWASPAPASRASSSMTEELPSRSMAVGRIHEQRGRLADHPTRRRFERPRRRNRCSTRLQAWFVRAEGRGADPGIGGQRRRRTRPRLGGTRPLQRLRRQWPPTPPRSRGPLSVTQLISCNRWSSRSLRRRSRSRRGASWSRRSCTSVRPRPCPGASP